MASKQLAQQAADDIAKLSGAANHEAVVVLGSGWTDALDSLGDAVWRTPAESITGFIAATAPGHTGELVSVDLEGHRILVLSGRTHLYEGHGVDAVVHPIRTAAAAGCRIAVLTNANGSLRDDWGTGTGMIIADHLNLSFTSPLVGAEFVDLPACWSPRLNARAASADPELASGVYAMLRGPHYQTVAEAMMLRTLGADVVGMSAVLESIASRAAGMENLGLSVVTTVELDRNGEHAALNDPDKVVEIAAASATRLGDIIRTVLVQDLASAQGGAR